MEKNMKASICITMRYMCTVLYVAVLGDAVVNDKPLCTNQLFF